MPAIPIEDLEIGPWGWPFDPRVKRERGVALPPVGHTRRCQSAKRYVRPRQQCTQWACPGRHYCKFHGGRNPTTMPSRYSKHAGPKLSEFLKGVEELGEDSPTGRLDISEEIDLARALAGRSVEIFDATFFGDMETSPDLKAVAAHQLKAALTHVSDLAYKASKIFQSVPELLDGKILVHIIDQVSSALQDEELDEATVERIIKRLHRVQLPERRGGMAAQAKAEDIAEHLRQMDTTIGSV